MAAYNELYKKYPPIKYIKKYTSILTKGNFKNSAKYNFKSSPFADCCAASKAISVVGELVFNPKTTFAITSKIPPTIAQIINCNNPAKVVPMIFPIIN